MSARNRSGRSPSNAARSCGVEAIPSSRKIRIPAIASDGHCSPAVSSGSRVSWTTGVAPVDATISANGAGTA